jgi:tRNA-splicing ligase RtcB
LVVIQGLKQISDVTWEIPTTYKEGMRVPARIYATKKLFDEMDSGVFEQITNVACLPGIVRFAYAMADAHWGYGFPIGGVAAFDVKEGVISPGGIGFDINCLHPDSKVIDEYGAFHRLDELDVRRSLTVLDLSKNRTKRARTLLFLRRREDGSLLRIRTRLGKEVLVTADHPLLTCNGMVLAKDVTGNDSLVVSGFEGVEYSRPTDRVILDGSGIEEAFEKMGISNRGNVRAQIFKHLMTLSLNAITMSHPKLPILLKVLGYVFGDGTIPRLKSGKYVIFYGEKEDLEEIREDIRALGFKGSIYHIDRHHKISTPCEVSEFDYQEYSLVISSSSLRVLLVALGAPYGKKAAVEYRLPEWIKTAERWQKRVFLAAYLGAELSKPTTPNGYDFSTISFSVSKLVRLEENAILFLRDINEVLASLRVETSEPTIVDGYRYGGVEGETISYRLSIQSNSKNLKRFLSTVGYLYNKRKERLASLCSLYLDFLERVRERRNEARETAVRMYASGSSVSTVLEALVGENVWESFLKHSVWGQRGPARVWDVEKFEEFCSKFERGQSGLVYDGIASIERILYKGYVYDLTIDDESHNFVADGVVVSNCGMRLIRTNLRYNETRPKIKQLVDTLFQLVPTGVGVKGFVKINQSQFDEVMRFGVKWCVENGYGWESDTPHVEEGGFIKGADPSKVSRQASSRGIMQLGTLGSGNHYLEIQVVDPKRYFNPDLAKHFGIVYEDQVLVMIHCGSRGFGHQVGTDYLRIFDSAMKKYGIHVKDRELACAPFSSKEGEDYYGAMICAANMAFANRQVIVHRVREAFEKVFHRDAESLDMQIIYDVCHNIAKVEKHAFDGSGMEVVVHRKGATRSFGAGHDDIPTPYKEIGQPVIIGGSMETGSYLLLGTKKAMEETFGSTAHGSGRTMSRTAAKKQIRGYELQRNMEERGIYVKSATMDGLAEEAGVAYKDISEVVETMHMAGISKKVVALKPIGNIKG